MRLAARLCGGLLCGGLLCLGLTAAGCQVPSERADSAEAAVIEARRLAARPVTEEQRQANVQSFDQIYTTIHTTYVYPDRLDEVGWEQARDELRPKVEQAQTMDEARQVMGELLGRLGESHFAVIPGEVYDFSNPNDADKADAEKPDAEQPDTEQPGTAGVTGFDFGVVDDTLLVSRIDEAGLDVRLGWEILEVDGTEIAPLVAKVNDALKGSTYRDARLRQIVNELLRGDIGDTVDVTFADGQGERRELTLTLVAEPGDPVQFGELPPINVRMDTADLQDGVAYFRLSAFLDAIRVTGDFRQFVDQAIATDAPGMVIDLRDNPGGSGAMAGGLSGFLVGERGQKLGTIVFRDTPMQLIVAPRATIYRGPVAVLVNGSSMSTSEIMAGGLQDLGRARIFGTPTPGAALPSYVSLLPNGDRFQYAVADYISTSGARLEGAGVRPDDVVPLDRQSLLAGVDPQLQAAVNWLLSESAGTSAEAPAEADADAARPTTNPAD